MSKGSTPRPYSVDDKTFSDNWERTFGRGVAERSKASGSNPDMREHTEGSNPSAPAISSDDPQAWVPLVKVMAAYLNGYKTQPSVCEPIYIDDETGT